MSRPDVSVIVPFAGDSADAERLMEALAVLRVSRGDELIVVDNSAGGVVEAGAVDGGRMQVVRATAERSSYYARNAGAAVASRRWLLFTDSDCAPVPDLLDEYFRPAPAERCAAVAGEIVGDRSQESTAARWARSRERLRQSRSLSNPFLPYGSTANLLVRRAAFDQVTGFAEGLRSGGDVDFCWRLQRIGFTIEYREHAAVHHSHRDTVAGLLRQSRHYGGSQAWLDRHYGSSMPSGRVKRQSISAVRLVAAFLSGRLDDARFYGLDMADLAAQALGYRGGNSPGSEPPQRAGGPSRTVCFLEFPPEDWDPVAATEGDLRRSRLEALRRSERPRAELARGLRVAYGEDDAPAARFAAAVRVATRHPVRALRTAPRTWGSEPVAGTSFSAVAMAAQRTRSAGDMVVAGERAAEGLAEAIAILAGDAPGR